MENQINRPASDSLITRAIPLVIFAALVIFLSFQVFSRIDSYLKNQAIDRCALFGRYGTETTKTLEGFQETANSDQPIKELFDDCLQKKGY